jgi:hypothetical protein
VKDWYFRKMICLFSYTRQFYLVDRMDDDCGIYDLPIEMLYILASTDVATYRALLALPRFARSLSPDVVADFMIAFGYSVDIRYGDITWELNGEPHRIDGPAIIRKNGNKEWWRFGKLHRDSSPAVELATGSTAWYKDGMKHRVDGPAIERANGDKGWFLNDVRHRVDGPAIELGNGSKFWYLDGKKHRSPSVLGQAVGPAEEQPGCKIWWRFDLKHRDDGPAVEYEGGHKEWWRDGELYRYCTCNDRCCEGCCDSDSPYDDDMYIIRLNRLMNDSDAINNNPD